MKKKIISIICACIMLLSVLAGCGDKAKETANDDAPASTTQEETGTTQEKDNTSAPAESKEMIFAANGGMNMDPANDYEGWVTIRNGVAETLFKLSDELVAEPFLAESAEVSDDHMTWTIVLKDGVTFQNGKAMDGTAVKAYLERLVGMNERAAQGLKIDHVEADGLTVKITTTQPNPAMLNSLCDPYACIVDVASGEDIETKAIGTGPYMVESFEEGKQTVVVPYMNYWGGTPKLSKITIVKMDKDAMSMAMQTGEIDAAYAMSYEGQSLFKDDPNYNLQTVATSRIYMLYYNFHNEHLSNANVRKALSMLVDKESYGDVAMSGFGSVAVGCFPEGTPYSNNLTAVGYDVEGAKAILAQEGYADTDGDGILDKDGSPLSFELVTYSSRAELPLLSTAFQSQCKQVGIEININVSDSATDLARADQFDIGAWAYVTLPTGDPESYLNSIMSPEGNANFGHYENAQVLELLEQLSAEFDAEKRGELASQMVQLALDDNAFCFMDHLEMSLVTTSAVSGLVPHPSDYYQITVDTDISK